MYKRVVPRDLFNEANYIKCIGQLALIKHDNEINSKLFELKTNLYEEFGSNLTINLDGDLFDLNTSLIIKNQDYTVYRSANSRNNFPIYISDEKEGLINIFNEYGALDLEFIEFCTNLD